jgi:hypothetical protein
MVSILMEGMWCAFLRAINAISTGFYGEIVLIASTAYF